MCLCARTSTLADLIKDASPLYRPDFTCLHQEGYSNTIRKEYEEASPIYLKKKKR